MQSTQEQEWLQLIFENISDAIILLDRQGMIRYANLAAAAMAGFDTIEKVLDIPYEDVLRDNLVYDEAGDPVTKESFPSSRAFREGVTTKNKVIRQVNLRDGKQYWLSISTIPLLDESGKARFVIVFYADISERKSKEDKLKFMLESEKILSATGDFHARLTEKAKLIVPLLADWCTINIVSDDGSVSRIAVVHRDPSKNAMLEEFAERSAKESKAPRGLHQVIRTGVSELYAALDKDFLKESSESPERLVLAHVLMPRSAMIIPIMSRGKVLGVLSLAYSESDRRYDEQDLEFMQEFCYHLGILVENVRLYQGIEERDKAKDAFLAALSHELRNPIAPIRSSIELLRLTSQDEAVLEHASIIEHQFENMTKILNDLLDVTRFIQSKIHLEKKVIDLRALVERTVKVNQGFLSQKNIAVVSTFAEGQLFVLADETRLEQALTNILHNAEKFTPVGGTIWIELTGAASAAVITIRDNGVGIPASDIKKIFSRYFQGSNNQPHQKNGLGLGLVLVREIVTLHGGEIEAESDGLGQGSTFIVRLPLTVESPLSQQLVSVAPASVSSRKILIVDDNEAAARGLKKLLDHAGHHVQTANGGVAALATARGFNPDVVLLDIGLPDLDGYQVARKFREEFGMDAVLVALTGYGQEDDRLRALQAGFNYHLTKPAGIVDIKTIISNSSKLKEKLEEKLEMKLNPPVSLADTSLTHPVRPRGSLRGGIEDL